MKLVARKKELTFLYAFISGAHDGLLRLSPGSPRSVVRPDNRRLRPLRMTQPRQVWPAVAQ
jgi:hypothetical protein